MPTRSGNSSSLPKCLSRYRRWRAVPGKALPVLQVDSREGPALGSDWGSPVAAEEWERIARDTLGVPGVRGCVAFTGTALEYDNRGEALRRLLQQNHMAE